MARLLARVYDALRRYAEKDGRGYPDWAVRYLPVVRRLAGHAHGGTRILEVGANANGFARFADAPTVVVDFAPDSLREVRQAQPVTPVRGDAALLPFAPDTFDLCICMDTFEHLPPHARAAAAQELVRVLRPDGTAVIGFPAGEAAREAEARVRAAYRNATGGTLRWLEEHLEHGLPDADAMARRLEALAGGTHRVRAEGNAHARMWTWMWEVLMCQWPGRGNVVFQVLLRCATPWLTRMHRPPCYRTLLWLEPRSTPRNPMN